MHVVMKHPGIQPRLAVVSHVLPPSWSGQAVMLYRQLRDWASDEYCLISTTNYDGDSASPLVAWGTATKRLAGVFHVLPRERFSTGSRWIRGRVPNYLFKVAATLPRLFQRARHIEALLRKERCTDVLACTGDLIDPPASFLAASRVGIDFSLYIFDDYLYQWAFPFERNFARFWERIFIRKARHIIVPNEFVQKEYTRRYGVKTSLIHNPCESCGFDERPTHPWPARDGAISIVYTGAIYSAHYDAFRNLLTAIDRLEQPGVRLHLFTASPRDLLEKVGIVGPIVYEGHVPNERVREVQATADILFLPLAFESNIPEVIRTSAPGKIGEYLAAGRPVLVHAPEDSFVSWYFRHHRCGLVVDRPDPQLLADAIYTICTDESLRRVMVTNAQERCAQDFDERVAAAKFRRVFLPV